MKNLTNILNESIQYSPQQRFSELKPFLNEVRKSLNELNSVLEIGSAEGGLTFIFANIFKKVVALDINHLARYEKENITRITVNSHQPGLEMTKISQLGPYDLIFIDGDHSGNGVKRDFGLYIPLLSLGGIIALHDIKNTEIQSKNGCEVWKFAEEVTTMNLHISTKIFNKFTNEWGGLVNPDMKNHGGIQMWKFL